MIDPGTLYAAIGFFCVGWLAHGEYDRLKRRHDHKQRLIANIQQHLDDRANATPN